MDGLPLAPFAFQLLFERPRGSARCFALETYGYTRSARAFGATPPPTTKEGEPYEEPRRGERETNIANASSTLSVFHGPFACLQALRTQPVRSEHSNESSASRSSQPEVVCLPGCYIASARASTATPSPALTLESQVDQSSRISQTFCWRNNFLNSYIFSYSGWQFRGKRVSGSRSEFITESARIHGLLTELNSVVFFVNLCRFEVWCSKILGRNHVLLRSNNPQ